MLLMIEDRGCPYCLLWNAEVETSYTKSAEGKFAPLVRRFRGDPELAFVNDVVYSPTFVVLRQGIEVGRIVGHPGAELFWMQLAPLMDKAGFKAG